MSLSKKLRYSIHDVTPTPLIDQQEALLALPLEKKSQEDLKSFLPLHSIDDNQCTLRNQQRLARAMIVLPMLIGMLLALYVSVQNFIEYRKGNEKFIMNMVETARKELGNDFFLREDLPKYAEKLRAIGYDKHISFKKYMYFRYNYFKNGVQTFISDIVHFGLLTGFSLLFIYLCFFYPLSPPIFIDRKRQLVFSWHRGKVYAARYPQVGISLFGGAGMKAMGLALYTLNGHNSLARRAFQPCISILAGMVTKKDQNEVLAFTIKYLLEGKNSVAATDFGRFPVLFWRRDKKPTDFDAQLTRILAALDKHSATSDDPNPLTHQTPATSLVEQQEFLLSQPMERKNLKALKSFSTLNSIDDNQCVLRSTRPGLRISLFFSYLIISSLILWNGIDNFNSLKQWDEINARLMLDEARIWYGEEFHLQNDLPKPLEEERYLINLGFDKNNTIPFWEYIEYHKKFKISRFSTTDVIISYFFGFGGLALFFIPLLIHVCFFWPQHQIVIDRQRKLIYSWRWAQVYAAYYPQVKISGQAEPSGLTLYGVTHRKERVSHNFRLHNADISLFGLKNKVAQTDIHAFIVKYLIEGKQAVSEIDFKRGSSLLWRTRNRPFDFDKQLASVLEELKKLNRKIQENKNSQQESI
ncbi:hypothetical protein AB204_11335 [Xenorhabdus khoisanae]|uniref:Uncharacterized protein n=1 Tax=Xenorhabdus khoisanae TaxID=880157 RepID=A0A0J5FRV0_9GAMM|nr:hypothetical protein [Xenorhabdus khoisanae]KMJ45003.1 hypothetical protein AB204_11335 [Xenorhabdus khoisanae]